MIKHTQINRRQKILILVTEAKFENFADDNTVYAFKRQPHKMVKHTQTNHRQKMLLFVTEAKLANFAANNKVYPFKIQPHKICLSVFDHFVGLGLKGLFNIFKTFLKVLKDEKVLEDEGEVALKWFSFNDMLFYPGEFKTIIICRKESFKCKYGSKINDTHIRTKSSVTLLGVEIDNNFIFNNGTTTIS